MTEFIIPKPPKSLYKNAGSREDTLLQEVQSSFKIERIDYYDGINVYVEDASFPKKGFPTPEALWSAWQAKRLFVEFLRFIKWKILFFSKQSILDFYTEVSYKAVEPFILKDEYLSPVSRELGDFAREFLKLENIKNDKFPEILSFMIDIDDAYRYRIQDIFSETSKEKLLKNPRKELKRLIKIMIKRDNPAVFIKFKRLQRVLNVLLLIPSFKKNFKDCVERMNLKKCQMDEADFYWTLFRPDYEFGGMDFKTRQMLLQAYKIPTLVKLEDVVV